MSYFEELQQRPNIVWMIENYDSQAGEYLLFAGSIFSKYDLAVRWLENYCEDYGYELYEKQETEFTIYHNSRPLYSIVIFARELITD